MQTTISTRFHRFSVEFYSFLPFIIKDLLYSDYLTHLLYHLTLRQDYREIFPGFQSETKITKKSLFHFVLCFLLRQGQFLLSTFTHLLVVSMWIEGRKEWKRTISIRRMLVEVNLSYGHIDKKENLVGTRKLKEERRERSNKVNWQQIDCNFNKFNERFMRRLSDEQTDERTDAWLGRWFSLNFSSLLGYMVMLLWRAINIVVSLGKRKKFNSRRLVACLFTISYYGHLYNRFHQRTNSRFKYLLWGNVIYKIGAFLVECSLELPLEK